MQYYLRFHLSCAVVLSHLWANAFGSSGSYSVVGFYVISGYVITMVLNERYFQIENGLKKFWINRFFRLYPTFIVTTAIGALVVWTLPEQAASMGAGMLSPHSELGIEALNKKGLGESWWPLVYFSNITMLGIQSPFLWTTPIAFAPTSWSTNVELYYYAVLSFGAAASFSNTKNLLKISLVFLMIYFALLLLRKLGIYDYETVALGVSVDPFSVFYKTFLGWTFFFALGALAYFLPKFHFSKNISWLIFGICLVFPFIYSGSVYVMVLLRILFGIWVAFTIRCFSDDCSSPFIKFLGDLSYPLFLVHWPIAAVTSWVLGSGKNDPVFLATALAISLAVSALIIVGIERPFEKVRQKFRT